MESCKNVTEGGRGNPSGGAPLKILVHLSVLHNHHQMSLQNHLNIIKVVIIKWQIYLPSQQSKNSMKWMKAASSTRLLGFPSSLYLGFSMALKTSAYIFSLTMSEKVLPKVVLCMHPHHLMLLAVPIPNALTFIKLIIHLTEQRLHELWV